MKKNRFLAAWLIGMLVMAFTACTSEEAAHNKEQQSEDVANGLTTFVSGNPDEETPQTRTSLNYNDGNFFWEEGDKIAVKDESGTWKISSNSVDAHKAGFKFMMPGIYLPSKSYTVCYTGKNGTDNQVTIATEQTQKAPDTTIHFGEAGDCGIGTATTQLGNSRFNFKIDHKAAYLVFQPYTSNTILHDCFVTKIEVTTTNGTNIAGTYTLNTVTGHLTGSGSSKQITLITRNPESLWSGLPHVKGFPLNTSIASVTTNGAYMVIAPGKHALRVVYWIRDYTTGTEGTITKQLPAFTYVENNFYDMTANLDVPNYPCHNYYMWDAKKNYWDGHEWDSADPWQPAIGNDSRYPKPADTDKYYNTTVSTATAVTATNSCAGMPNVNEMIWYVLKGDIHWDNSLWTTMGHLYSGGAWIKKKAKIISDEGISPAIMASGYDGNDYRTYTSLNWVIYWTSPYLPHASLPLVSELASTDDYFYLPALGKYENGSVQGIGSTVCYWTSNSGAAGGHDTSTACYLELWNNTGGVSRWNRYSGARVEPTWFK